MRRGRGSRRAAGRSQQLARGASARSRRRRSPRTRSRPELPGHPSSRTPSRVDPAGPRLGSDPARRSSTHGGRAARTREPRRPADGRASREHPRPGHPRRRARDPRGAPADRTAARSPRGRAGRARRSPCGGVYVIPGSVRGEFFNLHLFVDVFSRKIVGSAVHDHESATVAAELVRELCLAEGVARQPLVLHADKIAPMKGATMLATLQQLGIAPSSSRPSVSNDNPFSEA
ncbi:MAG: transposase family protein, partial [Planctomycetes bacterium]|nr:transposase family protein [Planctomycetota bacterium]